MRKVILAFLFLFATNVVAGDYLVDVPNPGATVCDPQGVVVLKREVRYADMSRTSDIANDDLVDLYMFGVATIQRHQVVPYKRYWRDTKWLYVCRPLTTIEVFSAIQAHQVPVGEPVTINGVDVGNAVKDMRGFIPVTP